MTHANCIRTTYVLYTYIQNYIITIYIYMYCIERSVNISITRITRVNNICFSFVAISDGVSARDDFRSKVTMVADFCSLDILIHNALLGEIMISSTWTTRVLWKYYTCTSIPHFVMIHFHMQRFRFIDIWLLSFASSRRRWRTWTNVEITFSDIVYILHRNTTNFCILIIFHTFFPLKALKVTSTSNCMWKRSISLYMVFSVDRP